VVRVFSEALGYPLGDRERLNGTLQCLAALLLTGGLLRLAGALWPDWAAVVPAVVATVPILVFSGLVGGVLADDGFPHPLTRKTARLGGRVLAVTVVYLFVPAVTVVGVGYVTGVGTAAIGGVTVATLATVALLLTVVCGYLLPAATVVAVEDGIQSGLRRSAFRGTASGVYFLSWVGATVLVVVAWSLLAATTPRSVAALLGICWFAYAHVAAAALVAEGVRRTRYW
jgi:hypothetical protein